MGWPFRPRRATATAPATPPNWTAEIRTPPAPAPHQWRVGDLAEHTTPGSWWNRSEGANCRGPQPGDRLPVAMLVTGPHPLHGQPATGLIFARWPGRIFLAEDFRAVLPQRDLVRDQAGTPAAIPTLLAQLLARRARPSVEK